MARKLVVLVALLGLAAPAFAGAIVTMPGPLDSDIILFRIDNTGPTQILAAEFDLTGTALGLVIDDSFPPPIFYEIPPAGGTISYAGNNPARTVFGVSFTGFDSGEFSSFRWDPDTASDPLFGAVVGDVIGTGVTITFSDGSQLNGIMQNDGQGNLIAVFSAIPEPTSLAVFGLIGVVGAGVAVWRRRKAST